jgi:hypothetical protein
MSLNLNAAKESAAFLDLITVKETASLLKRKDIDTIYGEVARGVYPPGVVVRIARHIWFNRPALIEWLSKGGSLADLYDLFIYYTKSTKNT